MRKEFPKPVKREALRRSGGQCEAEGPRYGWPENKRCNADLAFGVQFDHGIADSHGGKPTLENCVAVCIKCHAFKTKMDTEIAAKLKRVSDKAVGIARPKGQIRSRGFKQYEPNVKQIHETFDDEGAGSP